MITGNSLIVTGLPGGGGCRPGEVRSKRLKSFSMERNWQIYLSFPSQTIDL